MSAFAHEAVRIHETVFLSDALIARGTGAARSTVRDWLALRTSPTGARAERLAELAQIADRAARVMRPEYVPVWLTTPVPALHDHKPIDLLARGRYRPVARLLAGLEDFVAT